MMKRLFSLSLVLAACGALMAAKPNIVLVITDDQGYGDIAAHGNPVIKTPHLDTLIGESSSLRDYHVAPTCSPSRSALMTGHWTNRTGVWHTILGRSMLRANEVTVGQMLKDGGYETGMFGKWHMGDNYPYRPEDRGFTEVYRHGGGGVGQTPDVWDNAYFDGAYFHNGQIVKAKGFCTDVFFEQAHKFITKCAKAKKPFFAYICTNAPHGPLHCPQKYIDMYEGKPAGLQSFFGMITNIDDNVGKTRQLLKELGIHENTIFIFTTDNGTAGGAKVFNAEMRGQKGSEYDGGHRVPFIMHWPAGGMDKKHESGTLTHAVDVAPTLLDMAGVKKPDAVKFDGVSIRGLLDPTTDVDWADRMLVTDSQRVVDPIKWRKSAVMSQGWRLVNGKELYHIDEDPGQKKDLAKDHPEKVATMRKFYEAWWAELEPTFAETTEIYLGHQDAKRAVLTGHDWISKGGVPWNQGHIRRGPGGGKRGKKPARPAKLTHQGHWAVKVITDGTYKISARRWPVESGQAINAALPKGEGVPGASAAFRENAGVSIGATEAILRINGKDLKRKPVVDGAQEVSFTVELPKGSHELAPIFVVPNGKLGAYYAVVELVE